CIWRRSPAISTYDASWPSSDPWLVPAPGRRSSPRATQAGQPPDPFPPVSPERSAMPTPSPGYAITVRLDAPASARATGDLVAALRRGGGTGSAAPVAAPPDAA